MIMPTSLIALIKSGTFLALTIAIAYLLTVYLTYDLNRPEAIRYKHDNVYKLLILSAISLYLCYRIALPRY
jgi:hypothetical protein